jgi:proline dehydrogenase
MFRQLILGVGNNPLVSHTVQQYGMRMGAGRFVAGSTLPEAISVIKDLNRRGIEATLDHLGESVTQMSEASAARDSYLAMLDAIAQEHCRSHVSLKLTMMGLTLSLEAATENLQAIVEKARGYQNFVRVDMEDSAYTAPTISVFENVWKKYPENMGLVLQAYLYRTMDDLKSLSVPPKNFRIVKGAYREPVTMAYPSKPDVDYNYAALVKASLELGNFTAVATHDEAIIGQILKYLESSGVPRSQVEFQMLFGVKISVLEDLARQGYTTRVYVPWGRDWYAYYLRRIAERPANLLFFARSLAKR